MVVLGPDAFEMVLEQRLQHATSYGPGHLFFIAPEDGHRFDITESTRFVFSKITADYVQPPGPQATADSMPGELLALLHYG